MEELVSIIIPTYNRANLICDALDSVAQQSHSHWECLIIDDGSTDNTLAIVAEYSKKDSRFSFYKRPSHKPKGANACRNYGLEKSSGQFICWLDSDDLLHPDHLSIHLNAHCKKKIDASISIAKTFETSITQQLGLWSKIFPANSALDELISGKIAWQTAAVLWDKNSLPAKPFNEKLQSAQEWTFHITMVLQGISYVLIDEGTVFIRRHEQRIGKDESAKKYKSRFLSRNMILKHLFATHQLDRNKEKELLNAMLNALRKSVRYKYIKTVLSMMLSLLSFLPKTRFTSHILKVILVGIPLYIFTGKGITLFKI
ncbi:MAG: hypothetical protein CL817_00015 [Croceibacter sp.]|nr:hypothetical protein [Croceibacter sp.]